MELQCQLLLYLDRRSILIEMRKQSEIFLDSLTPETVCKIPPFRFFLEIDMIDLLNVYPEVGKLLLTEPLKWKHLSEEILLTCIQSIDHELVDTIRHSQLAVTIRLKNISQLMVDVNPRYYKGLVCLKGRLIKVSKPTPYVYHTVWSCPEECDSNEIILKFIPKISPKCFLCRSNLYENSGLRRCGEQVIATFKLSNDLLPNSYKIVDDLISKLNLGSLYFIHGVVMKNITKVWSLELITPLPAPITTVAPSDINELYNACDGLPWKFIYCLASTIGFNICPLNCFMHLKINLLLSLTSIKANEYINSKIIHVLAAGLDTGIVGKIMIEGAKLACTSLTLGTTNTAVATSLIDCSGGICVMPLPLHTYSSSTTSAVLSIIETGEIVCESRRTKLCTAVWAQGMDFKKLVLFNVATVFSTVCRGDYGEYEDELAEFLLQKAIDPRKTNREEKQAMKDVVQYIDIIAGVHVELDSTAENFLKTYFLAARKERPRGVSINSMESLVTICLTCARLCRRQVTNIEDAAFAIWLHVSGSPEPRFAPDEYLQTPADIIQLHKVFNDFKEWLTEFTNSYGY